MSFLIILLPPLLALSNIQVLLLLLDDTVRDVPVEKWRLFDHLNGCQKAHVPDVSGDVGPKVAAMELFRRRSTDWGTNFWVPGNYKRALNRLQQSGRVTEGIMSYMKERAEVEADSDQKIRNWVRKYGDFINKYQLELGMLGPIMKLINDAHHQRLDANDRMRETVYNVCLPQLRLVRNNVRVRGITQLDKEFHLIQDRWKKAMKKVLKIKMIYHEACRTTHETAQFLNSSHMASGHGKMEMTDEARGKAHIKLKEYQTEVERCRTLYEATLYELNILKSQYVDDMKAAFNKCVEFEKARLDCIQDCLEIFAKAIDGMRGSQYNKAWANVDLALLNYTVENDLKYFSTTMGPDEPYNWPAFEEWQNRPSQVYY